MRRFSSGVNGAVARHARRSIGRHRLRSALIVALIAVPVAAGVFASTAQRTIVIADGEYATETFGRAPAALFLHPDLDLDEVINLLPERSFMALGATADALADGDPGIVRIAEVIVKSTRPFHFVTITDLDFEAPLAAGIYSLTEGRPPRAEGEVVISPALADRLGLTVGDTGPIPGVGSARIVGEAVVPLNKRDELVVVAPGTLPLVDARSLTYLTSSVAKANDLAQAVGADVYGLRGYIDEVEPYGLPDMPVEVPADPGAPAPALAGFRRGAIQPHAIARGQPARYEGPVVDLDKPAQLSTMVTAALVAELALVAAAAFAVGMRRRIVEFGQLATIGASPSQLRRFMLAEAGFLGLLGALTGVTIGVVGSWLALPVLRHLADRTVVGLRWDFVDLIGPAVLGFVAAMIAAWWPSRTVARIPEVAALAGRVPVRSLPRWILPAAMVSIALGSAMVVNRVDRFQTGEVDSVFLQAMLGGLLVLAGAAAMGGPAIRVIGRLANHLPLRLRLVARDSSRNGARAAITVAAMVVVTALPVTLAAGMAANRANGDVFSDASRSDVVRIAGHGFERQGAPTDEAIAAATDAVGPATLLRLTFVEPTAGPDAVLVRVGVDRASGGWRGSYSGVAIADEALIDALGLAGVADDLAAGRAVALGTRSRVLYGPADGFDQPDDGLDDLTLQIASGEGGEFGELIPGGETVQFDLVQARIDSTSGVFPEYLLPSSAVTLLPDELTTVAGAAVLLLDHDLTPADQEALEVAQWRLYNENNRGEQISWNRVDGGPSDNQIQLIIVGAATALALLILAITTALGAVEVDRDVSVMVAVGAPPRLRRSFLGIQTWFHASLGALLGAPVGVLLYWSARVDRSVNALAVPWPMIIVMVVALPALVGVATGLGSRSGRPVVSRRLS